MVTPSVVAEAGNSYFSPPPKTDNDDVNFALQFVYTGQFNKALEVIELAVKNRPDNYAANFTLGTLYLYFSDRTDQAEKYLLRARRLAPYESLPVVLLLELYQATGRPARAIECARDLARLFPDSPYAHYQLGILLRDQAAILYEQATARGQSTQEVLTNQTFVRLLKDAFAEIQESYRQDNTYLPALTALAKITYLAGNTRQAEYYLKQAALKSQGTRQAELHWKNLTVYLKQDLPTLRANFKRACAALEQARGERARNDFSAAYQSYTTAAPFYGIFTEFIIEVADFYQEWHQKTSDDNYLDMAKNALIEAKERYTLWQDVEGIRSIDMRLEQLANQ